MMTISLAGAGALGWGAADFLGGKAARTAPAVTVVMFSQLLSLPALAVFVAITGSGAPRPLDLALGAAAGGFGLLGMVLLYGGIATGGAAVVAPVSAVVTALVPLIAGLFLQATPGPLALTGVCSALASIALVSIVTSGKGSASTVRTLACALIAGGALGSQLLLLTLPGPTAGLWPLVGARASSILCAAAIIFRSRRQTAESELRMPLILVIGLLDTAGYVFYLYATAQGLLSLVGPIVSLYPVSTVVLAVIIDRERVGRIQSLGLGFAAAALVLTAL